MQKERCKMENKLQKFSQSMDVVKNIVIDMRALVVAGVVNLDDTMEEAIIKTENYIEDKKEKFLDKMVKGPD